jgi:hypothetical protein
MRAGRQGRFDEEATGPDRPGSELSTDGDCPFSHTRNAETSGDGLGGGAGSVVADA